MNVPQLTIWTVGHSNHAIDAFVSLLMRHDIELLIDIRRFPGSRSFPHFNRENLAECLQSQAIDYRWLEGLGGRRAKTPAIADSPNDGWRNKSFRNYADYMLTANFRAAFAELASIGAGRRTAIMCSESVYWRCHRRLVSDYIVASGGEVKHIFPGGETKPHSLTSGAVVEQSHPCRIVYPGEA